MVAIEEVTREVTLGETVVADLGAVAGGIAGMAPIPSLDRGPRIEGLAVIGLGVMSDVLIDDMRCL